MNSIKNYILQQVAEQKMSQNEAKQYLLELNQSTNEQANVSTANSQAIAIVGMAGRFPNAKDIETFWHNLRDGVNCIRNFPENRQKDVEPLLRNPYYMEYLTGAPFEFDERESPFVPAGYMDSIDKFDAAFFGIPPSEALYMDPNQRLMLETAWHAMENAGYGGERLYGSDTGVFIGREGTNISQYRFSSKSDPMQLTGSWESIIASRISYLFDLRGPSMLVDTACSASLVSVHMACQSILSGECSQALAGGVNLVNGELKTQHQGGMSLGSVESADSMVRTFDGHANGTVWGEGVAMLMLKPLDKALADGDPIHAVIKGSAINNDGASNALTAPNAETQEEVIVKAWQKAGIDPQTLSYIEAHGTGTVLGDPIEFKGLTNAFRRYTNKKQFCAIGSLKTNMGHLVASSGAASLIKVVESIKHAEFAPTINFNLPNPYINFASGPLYIADKMQPWPESEFPKRAAISSFGFNHTNCHLVVEEAPVREPSLAEKAQYCLVISAKKQVLLKEYVTNYQVFCAKSDWNLADLCFTAATGRGHYNHRIAILAENESQLQERLKASISVIDGGEQAGIYYGQFAIVSDKKSQRADFEITEREKKAVTEGAEKMLDMYVKAPSLTTLNALAQAYTMSAEIDWQASFQGETRRRLAQPVYPYEQTRYWAEPKISAVQDFSSQLHPLVQYRMSAPADTWLYGSRFSNEQQWVLADHKIKQMGVVPGTSYLEMARFAAKDALGFDSVELADVFFLQPMVVDPEQTRQVQLTMKKQATHYSLTIASRDLANEDEPWQQHVEGTIKPIESALPLLDNRFETAIEQADQVVDNYMEQADTGVFQFGPHWHSIRKAWYRESQVLAKLELPSQFHSELETFCAHPAMLDNAMNVSSQSTGQTYLPFMYKSIKMYRPFKSQMYSLVMPTSQISSEQETHSYEAIITDLDGLPIIAATGYMTKKVHSFDFSQSTDLDNDYLAIEWNQYLSLQALEKPSYSGPVLLISSAYSEQSAINSIIQASESMKLEILHAQLGEQTADNIFSATEQGITQLLSSKLAEGISGIIFACDYPAPGSSLSLEKLASDHAQQRAVHLDSLFYLAKAVVKQKLSLEHGLMLLSSGAFKVIENDLISSPMAASAAQFALSFAMETAGLDCRVVDVDSGNAAEPLLASLTSLSAGKIHAIRDGMVYQQQLQPAVLKEESTVSYKQEGVYLITGGLGGLGLAAANHVCEKVKGHVVLLGRSPLADQAMWSELATQSDDPKQAKLCANLVALQSNLSSLSYQQVDVSDVEQVQQLILELKNQFGRINGVFHAAGVAGDGFVLRKSFATFNSVLTPKLQGTVNLLVALNQHQQQPDFISFYSSITALTGGEGQSDYAAANAFLDAIAEVARQNGQQVNSINWPSWSEVGMSVDYELDTDMTPFTPLSNDEAFAKFDQILSNDVSHVLPADINPEVFKHLTEQLPFTLAPELSLKLTQTGANTASNGSEFDISELQITGKSEDELNKTETDLAIIYAQVLGIKEIDVFTNFQDMGGNSIIATHLLKVIETEYPGVVDMSDIFSYPSIDVMAEYINDKVGIENTSSGAEWPDEQATKAEPEWDDLMDKLIDGDESVDSLLDQL